MTPGMGNIFLLLLLLDPSLIIAITILVVLTLLTTNKQIHIISVTMATSQMQPVAGSPPSSFPGHGFGSRQGDSLSRSSSSWSLSSSPSKWLKPCQDQLVHPRPLSAHHRQGPRQPLPKVRRVFFFFHQLHWFFTLVYKASHIIGPMTGGGREKLLNFWT